MNETYLDTHHLTIKEVSERLDIPKPTIRFWEKELEGIIVPLRSSGGQRRYTESHIPVFEQIKKLRNAGRSISQVKDFFNSSHDTEMLSETQNDIDMLTERIAEIVKLELSRYLKMK
jgi:MerR family transcriptional regulator, aldehyde-responsive regulator